MICFFLSNITKNQHSDPKIMSSHYLSMSITQLHKTSSKSFEKLFLGGFLILEINVWLGFKFLIFKFSKFWSFNLEEFLSQTLNQILNYIMFQADFYTHHRESLFEDKQQASHHSNLIKVHHTNQIS